MRSRRQRPDHHCRPSRTGICEIQDPRCRKVRARARNCLHCQQVVAAPAVEVVTPGVDLEAPSLLLVGVAFGFAPRAINAPARRLCIRASDNAPSPSPFSSSPFAQSSSSTLTPIFIGRTVVFAALMSVLLPPTFAVAAARAVFQRVTKGTPDQILPTGETGALGPGQDGYGGQMLFDRPIDPARLRAALEGLVAEAGLAPASARLDVEAAARAVSRARVRLGRVRRRPERPGHGLAREGVRPDARAVAAAVQRRATRRHDRHPTTICPRRRGTARAASIS